MPNSAPIEIGLVLYPSSQMSCVLGLTDLFGIANGIAAAKNEQGSQRLLRVTHWALESASAPPARVFDTEFSDEGAPDVFILPPAIDYLISVEMTAPLTDWLRERHGAGAVLASVCAGAFLLAETGLLAGRTVTTHWSYAETFRERFPEAHLDPDRLIIDDGDIITAGGLMSWTDLGLKLVDRFLGPTVMVETAQVLLVDPPGREQRYYSTFSPRLGHGDAAILKVQHWLQVTKAKDMDLSILCEQAGLEERTFLRRFQKATGLTTTEYCQRLRIGRARELLQFGALSIDRIAWEVGYNDPGAFRKIFARFVGLTPSDYRRRFHA
ncbi:AraC family transcriptional regulator [Pararhizobium polonicum]|uniref:AraC family transcriptional regulator n=1 Tax=Pararhizobium polonicum TaxID=1612624 RepID=A0A1C7P385_9HYPH|nr:GlxA family transcriptional regulator [Pararhizobium polonicum]OBZ95753.1 AraC family transcriptional regulator [Pararhizobium polonicum]